MTDRPVTHRRVLGLALPIMLANLSVPLVGVVDTAVMGRLPGAAQIGAVALGATVFSFLFWGFGFLRMGTTGLVAQTLGRRDTAGLRGLCLNLGAAALLIGLILVVLRQPIVALAQWVFPAGDTVREALGVYTGVRLWSAPAVLGNYVLVGVFVGLQRTGLALLSQLVLNLSNAGLSLLFVLVLDMGIAGVAWASVIAESLALGVGLGALSLALAGLPGRWPWAALRDRAAYVRLFRVNGDLFVRTLCLIAAFAWFNARGAAQGEWILAANAVLLQLVHVLAYGLDGFAHAAETLVGHARGAGRRNDYLDAIRIATVWALGTAVGYCLVYLFAGESLVAALTIDERVRTLAAQYLPWLWLTPLVAVWSYLLDGIFVGTLRSTDMRDAMIVSLIAFLIVTWLGMELFANHGLWAALTAFFAFRALTLLAAMRLRPLAWPVRADVSSGSSSGVR